MIKVHGSVDIGRRPQEVCAFMTDLELLPEGLEGVRQLLETRRGGSA